MNLIKKPWAYSTKTFCGFLSQVPILFSVLRGSGVHYRTTLWECTG